MTAPFAEYELSSVPDVPHFECSMAVGSRFVLDPKSPTFVSRRRSDPIFVMGSNELFALGWGGTRNHLVEFGNGAWHLHDLGSHSPVRLDGAPVHRAVPLRSGAQVSPARGLVFTFFVRDDLEALAADEKVAELLSQPHGRPVLLDWLLERLGGDPASAERALQHFAYRLAHAGTL